MTVVNEYKAAANLLATGKDLTALTAKARERHNEILHPFMKDPHPGLPWPCSLIGDIRLFQGFRECGLINIQPGGGKTSGFVIPQAAAAPGALVVTSNKADGMKEITALRSFPGSVVHNVDPMGLVNDKQESYCNPLEYVVDDVTADELATIIAEAEAQNTSRNAGEQNEDLQFGPMGKTLLQATILAMALTEQTLGDVHRIIMGAGKPYPAAPVDEEGALIVDPLEAGGWTELSEAVASYRSLPDRTRMSAWATARRMVRDLGFKHNIRWTTPAKGLHRVDVEAFLHGKDTLLLISQRGSGGAGFLVMSIIHFLKRAAQRLAGASGGRLPKPVVLLLDEICNIAAWPTLPFDLSYFGSIGLVTNVFIQGLDQAQRTWGKDGAEQLVKNANITWVGGGESAIHAGNESKTIGEAYIKTGRSKQSDAFSPLHNSTSTSTQLRAIVSTAMIANMPKSLGIIRAQELPKPCIGYTELWHDRPEARRLEARMATEPTPTTGGNPWLS